VAEAFGADLDQWAVDAVRMASDMARGYLRLTVTAVADDTVHLPGTLGARLALPELPVTAVTAVSVDGTALASSGYAWRRSGLLLRRDGAGWGGPDAEVAVTYDHGWETVPGDLAAVVLAAALRLAPNPGQYDYRSYGGPVVHDGHNYGSQDDRAGNVYRGAWAGWTLAERIVLDRYRRRWASVAA
jgi:hypothetical protein